MERTLRKVQETRDERKTLEVFASEDNQKLFARASPGQQYSAIADDEVLGEILKVTPADMVERAVVKDIERELRFGRACEERRVAKGTASVDGRDGRVVWLVRRYSLQKENDHGKSFSDFFYLGLFENVRKGQPIARIYPPKEGTIGRDALGRDIRPRPGKPVGLRLEHGLTIAATPRGFQELISDADGYVREQMGRVSVLDTLELPENVDFATGHIDFVGAVIVRGDVQRGLNVRARGDIEIKGSVLGENTLVSDGSISINGHHFGGDRSSVFCGKNLSVSTTERMHAEVHGSVIVKKEARDCSIRCRESIGGQQATLVGGDIWSVGGVEAKTLGNTAGLRTTVELRNAAEVSEEFGSLQSAITRHMTAITTLELHLGPYAANRSRVSLLGESHQNKITKLLQSYDSLKGSLKSLQSRATEIRASGAPAQHARVSTLKDMHAGVVLKAGDIVHVIAERIHGPISFTLDEHATAFMQVEYQPLVPRQISSFT